MNKIKLQQKTKAKTAIVEAYWAEPEETGQTKTLMHRITVPLEAFDAEIDKEPQAVETAIVLDWYALGLKNPSALLGLNLSYANYPTSEASLYLGGVHNWVDVKSLSIDEDGADGVLIKGEVFIEFANEDIAENESFIFTAQLEPATL